MKNVYAFILGALAVMALDMVWASKGYANGPEVLCESIMYPGTRQVFRGYSCPRDWYPV